MTDKVVPIKPESSSKKSAGENAKVLSPAESKTCTPLKPIDARAKSSSNSPTPFKITGGVDPVPLVRVPSEGAGPVPLTAGEYKSIFRDKYKYKVIENAGTIVFIHKKTGNISLIYFSDSERPERFFSEYTSTDSPLVTSGNNIHDKVLIECHGKTSIPIQPKRENFIMKQPQDMVCTHSKPGSATFTIPANKFGAKEVTVFKMTPVFTWRK